MKKLSPLFLFCLLSGCMVGPDYHAPPVDVPEKWENVTECDKPCDIQQEVKWWENYRDPILIQLVEETIRENYDLKVALAHIDQARASLLGAEAQLFPEISGEGTYTRNKITLNNQSSGSGSAPAGVTPVRRFNVYQAALTASWEIDIFGRLRRGVEAADASLEATADNMYGVLLTLIAEVATDYINLRSFQKQFEIVQKSVQTWDEIYKLNQLLLKAGLATEIDVAQAETARDQAEASLSPLQANIKTTMHRLAVLVGKSPTELYGLLCEAKPIPCTPDEFFVGIPSTLLRRRPDIRAAERNLAATTAEIGVAEGSYFPIFSLTGSGPMGAIFGQQSNKLENLFTPLSTFYSIGVNASWILVDFGRVRAMVNAAFAVRDQNFYTYKGTILNALADVENSLTNYATEAQHYCELKKAYEAAKRASDLSLLRYQSGLITFITVYQTELTTQAAELSLAQSQATLVTDSVSLYKALGGGWEKYPMIEIPGDIIPSQEVRSPVDVGPERVRAGLEPSDQ